MIGTTKFRSTIVSKHLCSADFADLWNHSELSFDSKTTIEYSQCAKFEIFILTKGIKVGK
jgi:hypothetical protein